MRVAFLEAAVSGVTLDFAAFRCVSSRAVVFRAVVFRAETWPATAFFAEAFFTGAFFGIVFFGVVFLSDFFFTGIFLAVDDLAIAFLPTDFFAASRPAAALFRVADWAPPFKPADFACPAPLVGRFPRRPFSSALSAATREPGPLPLRTAMARGVLLEVARRVRESGTRCFSPGSGAEPIIAETKSRVYLAGQRPTPFQPSLGLTPSSPPQH